MDFAFYIADEDENILEGIARVIEKAFPKARLIKHDHGLDLLNALMKEKFPSIVISEYNLPALNSLQIFKKVKYESSIKDSYLILLAPPHDKELPLKAIQSGADDVMTKPFSYDSLIIKLKQATKYMQKISDISLLTNERNELQKTINAYSDGLIEVFQNISLIKLDNKADEQKRVERVSEFITRQLTDDPEEIALTKKASKLYLLNKLFLPEKFHNTSVFIDGVVKFDIFEMIPNFIKKTVGSIPGFEGIVHIVNHIYENYDGSGFPDKLKGPEIPIGSRVLRLVIDYEFLNHKNNGKSAKTIEQLWELMNKVYDFRTIVYYDQFLGLLNTRYTDHNGNPPEIRVSAAELADGQVLSRDIIVISGHKLISAGTTLNNESIEKINNAASTESIIGSIFIRNSQKVNEK